MPNRKILHAADIHLDSPLQKLEAYEGAPVEQIRGASRRALENMVDLALDQSVDLVVIAGDLYDGDWPDQNTGLFFVSQASRLTQAGIPLVVIRGNHDAANRMTSSLPLPANPDGSDIMMASDRVDQRLFESLGIVVHGRSFRTRAESDNLAQQYPAPLGGMFNLGLLHTSLTGAEGHEPYAPCTPQQLADKQYDYWALGHIHVRDEHQIDGAAPVVFSGNVQGRHIREAGEKGCVLVEVDSRHRCETRFHPLDVVRWEVCRLDVSQLSHADEVSDAFQHWLQQSLSAAGGRLLVIRVELTGAAGLHEELHRRGERLEADLRAITVAQGPGAWLERMRIKTTPPAEPRPANTAAELEGPLESLAATVAQCRSDPDAGQWIQQQLDPLIKKLPVELGDDESIRPDDPEWRSRLIEAASAELFGRLQNMEDE